MDETGYLSLFLFNTSSHLKPYFRQRCHNKFGTGFCFLGTSTLIAASGHSTDSIDVSLWDTLMPPRSRLTCSFLSHEHGCTNVAYCGINKSLIIGGRKGGVFVYDLRQQKILRSIPYAHDSGISYLSVDNDLMATGSYDGVVKVWKLSGDSESEITPSKIFLPIVENKHKLRDSCVHCIRVYGKYLFSSSQGALSVRII
ncbi:DmX-like protein 2 [Thelohanellus kitauei]|uniref:DmX-like protein 2 n=1 Tax=Thelohanellus kitauei TaxID=669202 RepID=A0A0C2NF99_THEKT|nr:DmX-like protein 2 [Thelohanellus kitauei]